jgi:hypothetical protein
MDYCTGTGAPGDFAPDNELILHYRKPVNGAIEPQGKLICGFTGPQAKKGLTIPHAINNFKRAIRLVIHFYHKVAGSTDLGIPDIFHPSLHGNRIDNPVAGNIPQELEDANKIGFAGSIRADYHIKSGQVHIDFRETFEIFTMDAVDGHRNFLLVKRHLPTKRRYWLQKLPEDQGIPSDPGLSSMRA